MADRLKPCPFCGGEVEVFEGYTGWYIECDCGNSTWACDTKEELVECWNTRKPMDRIVEELEAWAKSSEKLYFEYNEEECYGAWRSYNKAIKIVSGEE